MFLAGLALLVPSMLVIALILRWKYIQHPRRKRRRLYIQNSRDCLNTLRSFKGDGIEARTLTYLRKINPLVFEEILLECFEMRGLKVLRNPRYTGDGGFDGAIVLPGGRHALIQAKRYSKHISAQHITEFAAVVAGRQSSGIFVHTGRTGGLARMHSKGCQIEIISGSRLVQLIRGEPIHILNHSIDGPMMR